MPVTYEKTDDPRAPALARVNGQETPVWIQALWEEGPHAEYVRKNGCGHCCAAMAARLHGVADIDPAKEYARCLELWGEPEGIQGHFQSVRGIAKILGSLGIRAEAVGVPETEPEDGALRNRIAQALGEGKQVIFWSQPRPGRRDENPFSPNAHYVMACGYDADGNIVIANSRSGIQLCNIDTVMETLYYGSDPAAETWGEGGDHSRSAGVVFVGEVRRGAS